MADTAIPLPVASQANAATAWLHRAFSGLSWRGVGLVVLLCVLNALRRSTEELIKPGLGGLVEIARCFGESMTIAVLVLFAVLAVLNLSPWQGWKRVLALTLAIVVASGIGLALQCFVWRSISDWNEQPFAWIFFPAWFRYASLGGLVTAAYLFYRRETEWRGELDRAECDQARLEQEMAEACLHVLQAQIEPHFLFNTLANVKRLYETDPAAGSRMLGNLMNYLAIALPHMREAESTLGRETALAEAYLGIQQIRMGPRLQYRIDVPEELRANRCPPMSLLTLLENAVKHGLNPLPRGGLIEIRAREDSGSVQIAVSDTGQGFQQSSGSGTGLANVRARLAALYGAAGELALDLNEARGVTARIRLPAGSPGPAVRA
jgi:signal transduction histidine kinase